MGLLRLSLFTATDGKRNIQSMKNQIKGGRRKKRDVLNGEALEPVMQNGPIDYDELLQSLNENYLHNEKRYLGELKHHGKL